LNNAINDLVQNAIRPIKLDIIIPLDAVYTIYSNAEKTLLGHLGSEDFVSLESQDNLSIVSSLSYLLEGVTEN
jgi:hypothetical protein